MKYSKEEMEVLRKAKEFAEQRGNGKKRKWNDIPPALDSYDMEGVLPSERNVKVGNVYLEKARNIKATVPLRFKARSSVLLPNTGERTTREIDVEIPDEVEKIIKEGYKVWAVIQPKWTKEDRARIDKIHQAYADIYGNREEYRSLYEQAPSKIWPRDRFPNGEYSTERWVPKVYNELTEEWQRATEKDCQNWDSIPENKKRVDFCIGILPDE